jgi:mRNA interferase MazF
MARETYFPDRGDLVHVSFQPSVGHEQTGPRYALVLSRKQYNRSAGLAVCCPITTKVKGHPFEVDVGGQSVRGVILADHVKSLDYRERGMSFIERAKREVVDDVTALVIDLIDPTANIA